VKKFKRKYWAVIDNDDNVELWDYKDDAVSALEEGDSSVDSDKEPRVIHVEVKQI
jgi:hypothetical protein